MLAICPSCQAKLKVPDQMENQKGKCPKCQNMFVITKCDLEEGVPTYKEKETPIVPVKKNIKPIKSKATSEVVEPNFQDLEVTPRIIQTNVVVNQDIAPSNSLGIASLVVAIMSYFLCWLPGIGVIISGLGVFLGLGGFFVALKRKGTGVGFSIAGLVLATISFVLTFCWSSAVFQTADKFSNASKKANENIAMVENQNVTAPQNNGQKNEVQNKNNEIQNDLIDASKDSAKFQNIEVKLKSVSIDYVAGVNIREFLSDEKLLKIVISIKNLNPNKKIDYDGWGKNQIGIGKTNANLTDNFGNVYKKVHFGLVSTIDGQIKAEAVYPNKPITDLIVFEVPLGTVEYLVLDLPAENLSLNGRIKFKIPKEMINLEIKKAQENIIIEKQKAAEAKEKMEMEAEQEKQKQMLAKKQADLEAEKAKQKALADIAIDEADRKKKLDEKGLTYYPLPRTIQEGKTADQWYQEAIKLQMEPKQFNFNNQKKIQDAVNALIILKEEGVPFLLEALQNQTTTQGRALYLQALKGELVHSNDIPVIIGSLTSNKNLIQTRMIALRILSKNPSSKKHYEKIRSMVADLFPNNNVKVEVAELLKTIGK